MTENEEELTEEPAQKPVEVKRNATIDAANVAADRMKEQNDRHEALLKRQESLMVEKTLGGKASVSIEKQEETPEDYAKKVLSNDL